jgi:hypothetical protein
MMMRVGGVGGLLSSGGPLDSLLRRRNRSRTGMLYVLHEPSLPLLPSPTLRVCIVCHPMITSPYHCVPVLMWLHMHLGLHRPPAPQAVHPPVARVRPLWRYPHPHPLYQHRKGSPQCHFVMIQLAACSRARAASWPYPLPTTMVLEIYSSTEVGNFLPVSRSSEIRRLTPENSDLQLPYSGICGSGGPVVVSHVYTSSYKAHALHNNMTAQGRPTRR